VRWAPTWRAESLALRPTTATIAGMCPRDQLSFPNSYIRAMIVESDRTDAVTVPGQALRHGISTRLMSQEESTSRIKAGGH